MRALALAAAILVAASAPAPARAADEGSAAPASPADRLVLRDGRVVEGRIEAEDDAAYAVRVGAALRLVEKSAVAQVTRAPAPPKTAPTGVGEGDAPSADAPPADRKEERRAARRAARRGAEDRDGDAMGPADGDGTMQPPADAGAGRGRETGPSPAEDGPPPPSDEVVAWIADCVHALGSGDTLVRRSAAAALASVGPPALPELRRRREGADPYRRADIDRVIALLERLPPERADPRAERLRPLLDRLRTDLSLDDRTLQPVTRLLVRYAEEGRALLADARDGVVTAEDARTRLAELRAALRKDMAPHMTTEQIAHMDALIDEYARRMAGAPAAPPPRRPAEDGGARK